MSVLNPLITVRKRSFIRYFPLKLWRCMIRLPTLATSADSYTDSEATNQAIGAVS